MATVRNLKKDIDYLLDGIELDCLSCIQHKPSIDKEKVYAILEKACELRNSLYDRINHPDGKDNPKLVKAHFRSIGNDMLLGFNEMFQQISELAKA